VDDFGAVDEPARALARRIEVRVDPALAEMEARLETGGAHAAVAWPHGSPAQPMDAAALRAKVHDLAGDRLHGVLDDVSAPAGAVVAAAGLWPR
jgi:hypothetical protein